MEKDIALDILTKREYTPKEWLTYYKNIWVRNLVARTIDVNTDTAVKAKNPKVKILSDDGSKEITVSERLEFRKIGVQDALDLIAGIDRLLVIANDAGVDFADKYWSPEALKVDTDMLPAEPVVGGVCQLDNGQGEGVYAEVDGKLICVVKEAPATPADAGVSPEAKV